MLATGFSRFILSLSLQEVADVTVEKSAGGDGKDVKK